MTKFDAIQPGNKTERRSKGGKTVRAKKLFKARKPAALPVARTSPAARSKNVLWFYVSVSMIVIVVIWFFVVGLNLQRTSTSEQSLYDRIKQEITNVFRSDDDSPDDANVNDNNLEDLEQRVFPNININHSGTFTTTVP
ncbi:MAG: hypothetical protein V1853_03145 [bacterium]